METEIERLKSELEKERMKVIELEKRNGSIVERYEKREKEIVEEYSLEIKRLERRERRHRQILERLGVIRLTKFRIRKDEISKRELIGKGGFGCVYRGDWRKETKIAIKEIEIKTNINLQNVIKEFQMQTILVHPNILQVHGYAKPTDTTFQIIMELMDTNMYNYVRTKKPTLSKKLFIMKELVEGLKFLHDHRPIILHRDLKCSNILIDWEGKIVKITDFGLHKTMTSSRPNVKIDDSFGTLKWKAPELIDVGGTASIESDIYSLGITFWEILFEDEPYAGCSFKEIFEDVAIGRTRPDLTTRGISLPEEFVLLLKSMWNQDPEGRPNTSYLSQWLERTMKNYGEENDIRFPDDEDEEEENDEGEGEEEEEGKRRFSIVVSVSQNTSNSDSCTNWSDEKY